MLRKFSQARRNRPTTLAFLLIACGAGALSLAGCAAPHSTATETPAARCDKDPKELLHRFADTFNEHDATALAALFEEDAVFINIYGQHMNGRTGIEEGHAKAFDSRIALAKLEISNVDGDELSSRERILYGRWTLQQDDHADTTTTVPEGSGTLTVIARCTGDDEWLIAGATNVRESTPPS